MSHEHLDDKERVNRLARLRELLESGEQRARESRAQQMRARLESAGLAGALHDLLVAVLADHRATATDEQDRVVGAAVRARIAPQPCAPVPCNKDRGLLEKTPGGDDVSVLASLAKDIDELELRLPGLA